MLAQTVPMHQIIVFLNDFIMNKRIIASLALLGSMLTINAYTVEWAIPPQESTLSFWRDGLYLISNEDQQGLVNVHGHLLCSGDEIHYVGDGIHIIVEQTNMGYVIKGLLNREHEFVPVPGGLYKRGLSPTATSSPYRTQAAAWAISTFRVMWW